MTSAVAHGVRAECLTPHCDPSPTQMLITVPWSIFVVTYVHYACVADCADAMADEWEDTSGCA